ncbi:hypothetical protein CMUST_03480 [Corynebacterium mustelae]|uniref:Uncharacterized protein n=1 Tax=Corynebacterium mustelae TaxID=571915 RepID=A0A0G3GWV7_9CORY|nr:hypothetical protein [Corynebacterium mustelae]AKK05040.1 hypothetical protein CMUST_03480 [Corynebacterium mustelae]
MTTLRFELTEETTTNSFGVTLYRIRATTDIPEQSVSAGDLGGWVSSPHTTNGMPRIADDAWVADEAEVFGEAQVAGTATVSGRARVYGHAHVAGKASVENDAQVFGNARVLGAALVCGNAQVSGDATVGGNAILVGTANVTDAAVVTAGHLSGVVAGSTTIDGPPGSGLDSDLLVTLCDDRSVLTTPIAYELARMLMASYQAQPEYITAGDSGISTFAYLDVMSGFIAAYDYSRLRKYVEFMARLYEKAGALDNAFDLYWNEADVYFELGFAACEVGDAGGIQLVENRVPELLAECDRLAQLIDAHKEANATESAETCQSEVERLRGVYANVQAEVGKSTWFSGVITEKSRPKNYHLIDGLRPADTCANPEFLAADGEAVTVFTLAEYVLNQQPNGTLLAQWHSDKGDFIYALCALQPHEDSEGDVIGSVVDPASYIQLCEKLEVALTTMKPARPELCELAITLLQAHRALIAGDYSEAISRAEWAQRQADRLSLWNIRGLGTRYLAYGLNKHGAQREAVQCLVTVLAATRGSCQIDAMRQQLTSLLANEPDSCAGIMDAVTTGNNSDMVARMCAIACNLRRSAPPEIREELHSRWLAATAGHGDP